MLWQSVLSSSASDTWPAPASKKKWRVISCSIPSCSLVCRGSCYLHWLVHLFDHYPHRASFLSSDTFHLGLTASTGLPHASRLQPETQPGSSLRSSSLLVTSSGAVLSSSSILVVSPSCVVPTSVWVPAANSVLVSRLTQSLTSRTLTVSCSAARPLAGRTRRVFDRCESSGPSLRAQCTIRTLLSP